MTACVQWTRCQACMAGGCYDEPTPHPWADQDDIDHAAQTGQPEPTGLCGCRYCGNPPSAEKQAEVVAAITALVAAGDSEPSS